MTPAAAALVNHAVLMDAFPTVSTSPPSPPKLLQRDPADACTPVGVAQVRPSVR
jgi:hypothetical protein